MKINKLTATFGKFNNDSITFHDGLNVIYAPNESGKSTWCAFIKAMLYGVDSSERARAGYIPEKQRYAPWSGAPMEGSMELTADRCGITLHRSTRNKNAPMQEFSAVYTGTAEPVKKLTGVGCGEQLTGVNREVFCRSAFVEQGSSVLTGSPELEKRIQALLSTGEEETSFSEAEERLLAWQRKRKFNRRGMLPELDQKIDDTAIRLEAVKQSAEKLSELEDELATARKESAELETAVTEARKQHRRAVISGLNTARAETRARAEEQNQALTELNRCRETLRHSLLGNREIEQVEAEAERDIEEIQELRSGQKQNFPVLPAVLCFLLSLFGAVSYQSWWHYPVIIAGAVIACAVALAFLFMSVHRRRENVRREELIDGIYRRYGADSVQGITERLDEHHANCMAAKKAAERERAAAAAADEANARLSELEARATEELDFISGSSKAAELGKQLVEKRRSVSQLSLTVASEQSRLSMMGDSVILQGELNSLRETRNGIQKEYDAIENALTALREADDEIQSRFSPQLGGVASRYMAYVTDGKYEDVLLSKDFSAKARARNEIIPRESGYLSAGTEDLLYLAVRLAVCELALPEGEPCPLIIDDALVNLDDERSEQAMKLLAEIARDRQVILFTCRQPVG